MGAQHSSHHEPLNMGGIGSPTTPAGGTGPAPDFNRASQLNNSHRMVGKKKSSLASKALNPRNTIRKSLRKRREKRERKENDINGVKVSYDRGYWHTQQNKELSLELFSLLFYAEII